ncbi:MAG: DNA repair protein RecN [Pseudomonadota bacterium]
MLTALSIRDFVLIRKLDLEPSHGLTTLTGETGAGKSIILDALGQCLGRPAEKRFVRTGAACACVTAEFTLSPRHGIWLVLSDHGVHADPAEALTLKRVIRTDGPARAFINDQIVGAGFLTDVGERLVEVHGQHAASSLMRPSVHQNLLDRFAGADRQLAAYRAKWAALSEAKESRLALEAALEEAHASRAWLTDAVSELDALAAEPGEAARLAEHRAALLQSGKLVEAAAEALDLLDVGVVDALGRAARSLEGVSSLWRGRGGAAAHAAEALDRAVIEAGEAASALQALTTEIERDDAALEAVDERLQALRAAGRKHGIEPDLLPDVANRLRARLDLVEADDERVSAARLAETEAAAAWRSASDKLSKVRKASARQLERAIETELKPLKLDKLTVRVRVEPLDSPGPNGAEHVEFEVETNPGAGFGPLKSVASGGELARFSLALKCALAEQGEAGVMVFDEADHGVGGAVAAAVGARLAELAELRQVFAVTHSPQVAASGVAQWRVSKASGRGRGGGVTVRGLEKGERTEEIARMLSGAQTTPEARAAAERLLEGP